MQPIQFSRLFYRAVVDDCSCICQNINCHKVSVSKGRRGRSKLLLPTHISYQRYCKKMVIKTMLLRFLHSYLATVHGLAQNILISILSIFQKVPEEMVTLFLFLNIFTQEKLFLLFRRSCPWKTNIFSMFGMEYLLQEGIFEKNCQDLWVIF